MQPGNGIKTTGRSKDWGKYYSGGEKKILVSFIRNNEYMILKTKIIYPFAVPLMANILHTTFTLWLFIYSVSIAVLLIKYLK